jgi:hypothetical protein
MMRVVVMKIQMSVQREKVDVGCCVIKKQKITRQHDLSFKVGDELPWEGNTEAMMLE